MIPGLAATPQNSPDPDDNSGSGSGAHPFQAKCRVEGTDMMLIRSFKPIVAAAGFALVATAIWAPGTARAQPQDDSVESNSITNLEQRVWGSIVRGLGLQDPNTPAIDYRERSPLVVPPSRELPPPQARAAKPAPSWPNDPDVARARKANEAKRKLGVGNTAAQLEEQSRPISPDELNKGRGVSARSGSNAASVDNDGRPVAPSELGYFGGLFSGRAWGFSGSRDEVGTFTNEPPRTQLTEPPPGYQTPSPAQPYGVSKRIERTPVQPFDPAR
jgi:hypothetical protein